MITRTFVAIVHKEDGLYVAVCPEMGTRSQGYTLSEAVANLKGATEHTLEDLPVPVRRDHTLVTVTTFEAELPPAPAAEDDSRV